MVLVVNAKNVKVKAMLKKERGNLGIYHLRKQLRLLLIQCIANMIVHGAEVPCYYVVVNMVIFLVARPFPGVEVLGGLSGIYRADQSDVLSNGRNVLLRN